MADPRHLRPAHAVLVAGEVWLVDEIQPVAVVIDPVDGRVERLVTWHQLPAWHEASRRGEWTVLSDGTGLWVQSGAGPAARIDPAGEVVVATVRTTSSTETWRLAAAGPSGAWLTDCPPVQDIASSSDAPPPCGGGSRLLVAAPDGAVHEVFVEHAVYDVLGTDGGALVQIASGRGRRRHIGAGHWSWEPEHDWLLVPSSAGVPRSISSETHRSVPAPRLPSSRFPGWNFLVEADDADGAARWEDVSGGLHWRVGWTRGPDRQLLSVATGHDATDGREKRRAVLGPGKAMSVLATPASLLVVLARSGGGSALMAVDPSTGSVRELVAGNSVDVTAHCRPLGPAPADLDSYSRFWLRYWADGSGQVEPVEDGMSAGRARLVGEWPATAVEVTLDWARRPGVRLRRRLRLFDELGRHTPPEYSTVHLMEDLATDHVPPASAAVDGVLDI